MQSPVERSRAMVELGRVQQSDVEPWQSYVYSSRLKYSHGRVIRLKQSEVEPWQNYVESSRVKYSLGRVIRVKQSEVEPWQSDEE